MLSLEIFGVDYGASLVLLEKVEGREDEVDRGISGCKIAAGPRQALHFIPRAWDCSYLGDGVAVPT